MNVCVFKYSTHTYTHTYACIEIHTHAYMYAQPQNVFIISQQRLFSYLTASLHQHLYLCLHKVKLFHSLSVFLCFSVYIIAIQPRATTVTVTLLCCQFPLFVTHLMSERGNTKTKRSFISSSFFLQMRVSAHNKICVCVCVGFTAFRRYFPRMGGEEIYFDIFDFY